MPIIDRKTVTFHTTAIDGVDAIKYVDALWQDEWQPFDTVWEVFRVDTYKGGVEVWHGLPDDAIDTAWELAQQHQAKQHEND